MNHSILYYDGLCVFCNKSMHFIISRDKKRHFKIAQQELQPGTRNYDSIVLVSKGVKYTHSTAVIKSLILLGGIYRCAFLLFIFPKFLRDSVYKFIAKNRYKWFGKYNSCPSIPEDWKDRMIIEK